MPGRKSQGRQKSNDEELAAGTAHGFAPLRRLYILEPWQSTEHYEIVMWEGEAT